ncbi:hypothetical protein ACFXEL_38380 [Streptomyces sp. NPDC059382]|uniref:hypothetical protein n=1 Tax=Streptomyces sp. NPDC059382 TaxID=3346816 RepID=UPI0036805769
MVRRPARTHARTHARPHARLRQLPQSIFNTPWFQVGANLPGGGIAGILADINTLGLILMSHRRVPLSG